LNSRKIDQERLNRLVVATFAATVVGSIIVSAAHSEFWQRRHDTAPVASILVLLATTALLARHRWAWWVFVILSVTGLPSYVAYGVTHDWNWATSLGLLVGFVQLALLFSAPMRRYVRFGRWHETTAEVATRERS
jgi:hypothetical protein